MTRNPIRMARIVAEVTGDTVRASDGAILADPVHLSLAARAHLTANGWVSTGSEREFDVFTHVTA